MTSSMTTETRMLERRVSNNRADLNCDQQMNYFLAWFIGWSDLQKSDFVSVLAAKVNQAGSDDHIIVPEMNGLSVNKKPLSLFQCQLKLFKEWVVTWNEDKQEYLLLRLKDLDSTFFTKYQEYLDNIDNPQDQVKDFFEPGVPPELVRASRKTSTSTTSSPNVSINGNDTDHDEVVTSDQEKPDLDKEDETSSREHLSTIQEDE